jgi:hypothetical protein
MCLCCELFPGFAVKRKCAALCGLALSILRTRPSIMVTWLHSDSNLDFLAPNCASVVWYGALRYSMRTILHL